MANSSKPTTGVPGTGANTGVEPGLTRRAGSDLLVGAAAGLRSDAPTPSTDASARAAADAANSAGLLPGQGMLFTDDLPELRDNEGFRGPTACTAAGVTYRQLDYWARTGLLQPTVRGASGSGTQRLYSFRDILVLKIIKRLLDTGVSLQQIRVAVSQLRERGISDLARITLMSDGASVYECTSDDEVIDLLRGGQGVFGIAVGSVWREVEGQLGHLPTERPGEEQASGADPADELSARRAQRIG